MKHDSGKLKLYLAHRSALINYAMPLVGDRMRAEDVVQEAFIRFLPAMSGPGKEAVEQPVAYLYRVVRNLALDWARRRAIEFRHQQDGTAYWTTPSEVRTPEQDLIHRDEMRRVGEMLAELSDQARIAVEMHRFGGHTLEEIAEHLGISVTSTHRLIKEAVVRVASRLDPPGA